MKINCIAADLSVKDLTLIKEYIARIPFLKLAAAFDNMEKAVEFAGKNRVDLILIDLQMESFSATHLLTVLKDKPFVIYTTPHSKFLKQENINEIIDYLMKPVPFERFVKAVDKAYEKIMVMSHYKVLKKDYFISDSSEMNLYVKSEFKLKKMSYNEILYIEGTDEYVKIFTNNDMTITLQSMKNIEEILPRNLFARVNKNFIVALSKKIHVFNDYVIVKDAEIPIDSGYSTDFFGILKEKKLI